MQLEHSEFQDQLVRGLAHRMNNVLTLFHGYLGLLLDNKNMDAPTMEGLVKIQEGARAASELMDRTHSLVRPTKTVWRDMDLVTYLGLLRSSFEHLCGPRTKLEMNIPDEVPTIRGDVSRVKTAIVELVKNACEATFASGGTVKVELTAETPGHPGQAQQKTRWVTFKVSDDGPGISPEIADKIFTPFFSTKKKQNAAGLGLTVAQAFVQQHGGALNYSSKPGCTCFELRLPEVAG